MIAEENELDEIWDLTLKFGYFEDSKDYWIWARNFWKLKHKCDALKEQISKKDKALQDAIILIRNMNLENKELRDLASQFENIGEEGL